jgi:hypothetical protein
VVALITEKLARLDELRRQLDADRTAALTRKPNWELAQSRLHDLEEWRRKTAERLGRFTYPDKRVALDAPGVKVRVCRSDHMPRWEAEASIPLAEASGQLLLARQRSTLNSKHFVVDTCRAPGNVRTWVTVPCRCACRTAPAAR